MRRNFLWVAKGWFKSLSGGVSSELWRIWDCEEIEERRIWDCEVIGAREGKGQIPWLWWIWDWHEEIGERDEGIDEKG